VLGQRAYSSLDAVPEAVDIVDVFRRPEHAPAIAEETVRKRAGTLWLQLGITNQEAAARAAAGGLTVVMDRCTGEMVERFGIRSAAPVPSDAPAKG
jgi:predicted CoA-binding protein